MKKLIEYTVACGCEHFAVNYNYCVCANKHVTISGPSKICPLCAEPIVEQYTRVVGFLLRYLHGIRGVELSMPKDFLHILSKVLITQTTLYLKCGCPITIQVHARQELDQTRQ